MTKLTSVGVSVVTVGVALLTWRLISTPADELIVDPQSKPPEAAPLCPWRAPQADLAVLFPGATRYEVQTRVLSGIRSELTTRLGRPPSGDDNALHVYRIYHEHQPLGTVLTRRVKGDFGAIELVLGIGLDNTVRGVRIQRLREPEASARALQDPGWLKAFEGKEAGPRWHLGRDVPSVADEAGGSAAAVVEGAWTSLVLLDEAERSPSLVTAASHHH